MKVFLNKEHYCYKIHRLFFNRNQCPPTPPPPPFRPFYKKKLSPPTSTIFQNCQLPYKQEGGGSHYKWCANDITAYSKNNVIIFFCKQKNPISPLCNSFRLTFLFLLTVLYPSPYSPFSENSFPSLKKEEEIKG